MGDYKNAVVQSVSGRSTFVLEKDCDGWRSAENYMLEFIQNLIDIQKKFKCFNFGTQSVMNLMHLDNRIFVDRLWNLTPDKDDINKIKIIHWNGHSKPWNDKEKEINKIWWIYSNIINK